MLVIALIVFQIIRRFKIKNPQKNSIISNFFVGFFFVLSVILLYRPL